MKAPEYNGVITDGDQVFLVGGACGNFRVTTNDSKELVVGEGLRFQKTCYRLLNRFFRAF